MKSKKIVAAVLTLALTATTALAGCGNKTTTDQTGTTPDKDQYLNVELRAEPKTLDPSKATDLYASQVLNDTMEALTRIEQDDKGNDVIKPAGAEKWDISADGLTWTFHLRDFKWSDGQPVKASDYEYAIKRTLDPKTASQYSFLLMPIKGAAEYNDPKKNASADVVGVKALDDKTLEIKLAGPCAYFLNITYFKVMMPQRKDKVEAAAGKFGTEANTMVFNGPFTIKDWVHGNKVELSKNKDYWDAKSVKLDKVTMNIIKEEQTRMTELLNGSLDSAAVSKPEWVQKFDQSGKFNVIKGYDPSTSYDFFNEKVKLFSNAKVRKAFSLAVDREGIVKTLYNGLAYPAYGWCPPSLQIGGQDFRKLANYEPIKTLAEENKDPKALLIEGLKELGMDPDPSKITVNYLEAGTDQTLKQFAEFEQQMYQKVLGITVKIEYVEWAVFMKRTDEMQYEIAGMAWSGDYNDPMTEFDMWETDAGIVPTGWSNAKYDELVKKAGSLGADKNTERADLFKQAEKILLYDDAVIAPTVYRMRNTYRAKYVKGLMSPLFGSGSELKYAYTQGRPATSK
ncbi:MAG: oligopeptide/dipeptide transporter, oligopeptide/dipeptide-binding protein [Clostridiaceae bacterium]|nr:oligopeptide/dipeptide transporter, oligopeptide/dipeptide-binding protein [Clostridiaceae bacterium]